MASTALAAVGASTAAWRAHPVAEPRCTHEIRNSKRSTTLDAAIGRIRTRSGGVAPAETKAHYPRRRREVTSGGESREPAHAQRAVRRQRDTSFRHDRLGLCTCTSEFTSSTSSSSCNVLRMSASCNVLRVEDARKLSDIEGRDESVTRTSAARRGCGARRSLNATGDSTSEARRGRREIERSRFSSARFLEISSAFLLDFCSRLIRYKAQTDNQNGREEQCWRLPGSLGGSTLRPAPRLQVRGI